MSKSRNDIHYNMTITWSPEDRVYYVRIPEWDWALTSGRTFEEAIEMGKDLYETLFEAYRAGEIPPPAKILVA